MLSKSKGQVLQVAAVCMCFLWTPTSIPSTISVDAIIAAQNFVDTCCQHTASIAGRSLIDEEIDDLTAGSLSTVII